MIAVIDKDKNIKWLAKKDNNANIEKALEAARIMNLNLEAPQYFVTQILIDEYDNVKYFPVEKE